MLFDISHSQYNPKIITYDSHCIFILQNTLNLKAEDYVDHEFDALQAIKFAVSLVHKLAAIEELQLTTQHLFGQFLVKVME